LFKYIVAASIDYVIQLLFLVGEEEPEAEFDLHELFISKMQARVDVLKWRRRWH
jgi:hypothetical protein